MSYAVWRTCLRGFSRVHLTFHSRLHTQGRVGNSVARVDVHDASTSLSWRHIKDNPDFLTGPRGHCHRRHSGSSNGHPLNAINGESSRGDVPPATKGDTNDATGAHLDVKPASNGSRSPLLMSIPTALTVLRLFAIPPVVWLFQFSDPASALWTASLFVAASVTDWLDGFLARKLGATSSFGAFLDPVADKLMVCSVLILLCTKTFSAGLFATAPWALHSIAVAIICREVAMSALREWAASLGPAAQNVVAVSWIGKYKTALQLASLSLLLAAMNGGEGAVATFGAAVGPWGLIGAAILTVHSFTSYMVALSRFMS